MSSFGNVELNSVNVKQLTGLVVLFYLGLAFFASLPFMLCGVLNPVDAYVEGMGMVTTTGVTLVGIDELPGMFILWRSVMQWLGGFLALVLFACCCPEWCISQFMRLIGSWVIALIGTVCRGGTQL